MIFFLLYLVPYVYVLRNLSWYQGVEKDRAVAIALDATRDLPMKDRLHGAWNLLAHRANELYQFGKYVEYVPNARPYYGLDLVAEGMMGFVPRVLWPEKPNLEIIAMQRVYDAGIMKEGSVTSVKSNFYQDAYLSGGWVAIVLMCFMFGVLSMLISRSCERLFGGYYIGTCLIYTGLFGPAFNLASNFLYFVGTIWGSLITLIGLFVLGQLVGWIVPAGPSSRSPQIRDRVLG